MTHLSSSQESSDSYVPGTPLPIFPSRFFSEEEIPETPENNSSPHENSNKEIETADKTGDMPAITILTEHNAAAENLQHSENVTRNLGERTPRNTVRANMSALRAFCRFVTGDQTLSGGEKDSIPITHPAYTRTKSMVFSDNNGGCLPFGFSDWSEEPLKRIRFYLIEFMLNYNTVKTGRGVKPATMRGYITGLQRAFLFEWGYGLRCFEGPVFNCPRKGLLPVIDNKFSEQQSEGQVVKSHITIRYQRKICEFYFLPLFCHEKLLKDTKQDLFLEWV